MAMRMASTATTINRLLKFVRNALRYALRATQGER